MVLRSHLGEQGPTFHLVLCCWPCVEREGRQGHGTSPFRASVSSSFRWVAGGPGPQAGLAECQGEAFGTSELLAAVILGTPTGRCLQR